MLKDVIHFVIFVLFQEISPTSFCSAVIKEERETPGIESLDSADVHTLCVSSEAATVQGEF